MQSRSIISVSRSSPSFNTYSSAARVVEEFRLESGGGNYQLQGDEYWPPQKQQFGEDRDNIIEDDDDDFEFAFVCNNDPDMSPVSADEIFCNGQIKPTYPPLLFNNIYRHHHQIPKPRSHRLPLGKLMMSEDGETTSSSSSAEHELLDRRVKPGTYCVWTPKAGNRSNSSGRSSKRWKLRDLLYTTRNNSDRSNDKTCNDHHHDMEIPVVPEEEDCRDSITSTTTGYSNKDMKKTSYLPNTRDLVGIFSNINGFTRHVHPF